MATLKDAIMARSGPEDNLTAIRTNVNTSDFRTAGPDWAVVMTDKQKLGSLDYSDVAEQQRLSAQVLSTGPAGQILRELISRRDICARQSYVNTVRPSSAGRRDDLLGAAAVYFFSTFAASVLLLILIRAALPGRDQDAHLV